MKFNIKKKQKLHERRKEDRKPWVDNLRVLPEKTLRKMLSIKPCIMRIIPFVLLLLFGSFTGHPYYMSVTELEYKPKEKEIQIACKIFTDDFEDALKQTVGYNVNLVSKDDTEKNKLLIAAYLKNHLQISISNKSLQTEFLGFEQEGEATWSYLLVRNTLPFKKINVQNDLLYHLRQDQINIIHFTNNGVRKSYRLTYPEKSYIFSW
jgi:hypothetical protein